MKYDSIIFDLDGTLWDATKAIYETWKVVLKKHEEIPKKEVTLDEIRKSMGLQVEDIAKRYFEDLDIKKGIELMNECGVLECKYLKDNGGDLYDNLESAINKLAKKYKLFIVSNCQDGYIESFLKAHNMGQYFKDYECPGRTGLSKGENNKIIIERNNLKNPIYVGDTEGDKKAADYSGIPFVYARYGFGKVEKYDYVIDNIEDLEMIIK